MVNPLRKIGNTELYVIGGDITQISTGAIMTAINSGGLWFGGVDGAIQRVAGNHYHSQAAQRMPLHDLETVVARGNKEDHRGQFDNVVFVVDDLKNPLSEVVYSGLKAANEQKYKKILIPAIRMGVMAGHVEKTPRQTVERLSFGILRFMKEYGDKTKLENITFVVYRDQRSVEEISSGLRLI